MPTNAVNATLSFANAAKNPLTKVVINNVFLTQEMIDLVKSQFFLKHLSIIHSTPTCKHTGFTSHADMIFQSELALDGSFAKHNNDLKKCDFQFSEFEVMESDLAVYCDPSKKGATQVIFHHISLYLETLNITNVKVWRRSGWIGPKVAGDIPKEALYKFLHERTAGHRYVPHLKEVTGSFDEEYCACLRSGFPSVKFIDGRPNPPIFLADIED